MCGGGGQIQTTTNQTTTPTATAEEQAMEKIQLEQYKQYAPSQTTMFQNAFALGNKLLTGVSDQNSQQWQALMGGITPQQTQSMINTQDRSLRGQLQQAGIYDSGTAASGRLRAAADLSNTNAQFNVGALQNALNLALSGQAQVQGTGLTQTSQLGQQLAGLRKNQTAGTTSMPQTGVNLGILGTWGGSYYGCWVAAAIFGGWDEPKTCRVRYFMAERAPTWLRRFYYKNGAQIARYLENKPIFRAILRPLFEWFALMGNHRWEGELI